MTAPSTATVSNSLWGGMGSNKANDREQPSTCPQLCEPLLMGWIMGASSWQWGMTEQGQYQMGDGDARAKGTKGQKMRKQKYGPRYVVNISWAIGKFYFFYCFTFNLLTNLLDTIYDPPTHPHCHEPLLVGWGGSATPDKGHDRSKGHRWNNGTWMQ